jgi:hypothetical protein
MVVMMGPPAAGKGFFLGEPPPKFGWKLPQMLVDQKGNPLLTEDDIPERPAQDESDNHLRAIQFDKAHEHFAALKEAHEAGEDSFYDVLKQHWYDTKDGNRVELGNVIDHGNFPKDFNEFFKKSNKDFYVSMRGWHDDAKKHNEETGKPRERYKDEARYHFEESVNRKIEQVEDLLIVDSAGEDIDAQDYKGQIDAAKAAGYEVTVIFLHPEQADTELSNLARGKVQGKRMVDQSDITNWYEKNKDALKDIQGAAPDNFIHYRKGPPDEDPKKAAEMRSKARELMEKMPGLFGEAKEKAKQEVNHTLYAAATYKLNPETSYGSSLSGLPKKPEGDIADTVAKMNQDAEKRAGSTPKVKEDDSKPSKAKEEEPTKSKAPVKEDDEKGKGTRIDFLRAMGDKKVKNPNPESKDRFPSIKIRSLPWTYQKPYYQQWAKQASQRVADRFLEARVKDTIKQADDGKSWLSGWMIELAKDLNEHVKVDDYTIETASGSGPQVFVTIKGATEDATTARKAKQAIMKLMEKSIKKHSDGVPGFKAQVKSFNRGPDLLLECTVLFP